MNVNQSPTSRRQEVESTSLASVGYDRASRTLEIEFRQGGIYRYFEVPPPIHESLMKARSKGRVFVAEIRDRFPYTRVVHPASARAWTTSGVSGPPFTERSSLTWHSR